MSPRKANCGSATIGTPFGLSRFHKAIRSKAEFVENSIDAHAKTITVTRGREHGGQYLVVKDDGEGVPRTPDELADFKYVATHICDSIKRHLKAEGRVAGEFGIGFLSFWTVGQSLTMTSTGADQRSYQMVMSKGRAVMRLRCAPRQRASASPAHLAMFFRRR